MRETVRARIGLIASMVIFGTIGLVREYIPLPSAVIAFARAVIGALCLLLMLLLRRRRPDFAAIRAVLPWLILSGAALGFNWILLFEAYRCTTVAVATVCYYLAPLFVLLAAPLFFREKLTLRQGICAVVALVGLLGVSGLFSGGFPTGSALYGILYGLGAALLYAAVMLLGRKLSALDALEKTAAQLFIAAVVLLPYCCLTGWGDVAPTVGIWGLLLVAGVIHTGLAYFLYFGAMGVLPPQVVAVFSYIDPVVAVLLSALVLRQPMDIFAIVGTVLVLLSTYFLERK